MNAHSGIRKYALGLSTFLLPRPEIGDAEKRHIRMISSQMVSRAMADVNYVAMENLATPEVS